MAFDLTGRIALITGASSGLGAHFAEIFVAAGARLVIGARRIDRVEALAAELGDKALPVAIDVTDQQSIAAAYDAAEAHFGTVDTVIAKDQRMARPIVLLACRVSSARLTAVP